MTESEILDGILQRERGFVNRAADRGGPTNHGVTIATLASWRGRSVTVDDVRALTPTEARAILARRYVAPWAWLPDERLRVFLVDWAVTSWHDDPTKALQAAVRAQVDGALGAETKRLTLAALAAGQAIFPAVFKARLEHYMALALDEPSLVVLMRSGPPLQVAFLRGWIRRCVEFAA